MRKLESIDRHQARRIALSAQGFTSSRPLGASRATLRRLVERIGAVQIDSVNVIVRSQYMPTFSRLGPYDRGLLNDIAYGKRTRRLFEYWGHEASLLPLETFPLLRWRMERARRGIGTWSSVAHVAHEKTDHAKVVRETIAERGPMSAGEFENGRGKGTWWGWSEIKRVLEYLFWSGELTTLTRRNSFERVYDLTERVIPAAIYNAPALNEEEAQRRLLRIAAGALGIASAADLRDYFRLDSADAKTRIEELVDDGSLVPVSVEGWRDVGYVEPSVKVPRNVEVSALLSPFDSLIWHRPRAQRLFDFTYRLEIYTPSHKRVHGYYVMPYLLGDRLVARVDLKADRAHGALRVHAVHYEKGVNAAVVSARLSEEFALMSEWLELGRVIVPAARKR